MKSGHRAAWTRRRVGLGVGGLAASLVGVASSGEARKKRRRKRKPSPPPLAFAAVLAIVPPGANTVGGFSFTWSAQGAWVHPASGKGSSALVASTGVDAEATADQTRARIVAAVRQAASVALLQEGEDVPEDRIAVVLL